MSRSMARSGIPIAQSSPRNERFVFVVCGWAIGWQVPESRVVRLAPAGMLMVEVLRVIPADRPCAPRPRPGDVGLAGVEVADLPRAEGDGVRRPARDARDAHRRPRELVSILGQGQFEHTL